MFLKNFMFDKRDTVFFFCIFSQACVFRIMEEESFYEDLGEEAEEEHSEDESTTIDLDDTPCILTHADAGKCLHTLGRCDSGYGYAYLSMNASEKGLTDVSVIPTFRHVIYVNVSGNKLTSEALRVLEAMTNLLMLQADQNCLVNAELQPMPYLQVHNSILEIFDQDVC